MFLLSAFASVSAHTKKGCESCQSSAATSHSLGSFSYLLHGEHKSLSHPHPHPPTDELYETFLVSTSTDDRDVSAAIHLHLRRKNLASRDWLFSHLWCFDVENLEVKSCVNTFPLIAFLLCCLSLDATFPLLPASAKLSVGSQCFDKSSELSDILVRRESQQNAGF